MSVYIPDLVEDLVGVLRQKGFRVDTVSNRPGHTILLIDNSVKRVLLWLRSDTVGRKALGLFIKITKGYEYDAVIVVRKSIHADPIRLPPNWVSISIAGIDRKAEAVNLIVETVERVLQGDIQ